MNLNESEQELSAKAVQYIKDNKKLLGDTFANSDIYTARSQPITVFMAGIPGAGKTEVVDNMIVEWKTKPVHIDADKIREMFRGIGYNGSNAYVFQQAASHGVEKLFDHIQQKRFHAVVDGTFAHDKAVDNVHRALGRGRTVIIYFVYQDPVIAWKITKGREQEIGRRVPREDFIEAYFKSRENIKDIKKQFKDQVELNLIIKDAQENLGKQRNNIDNIDDYLSTSYTQNALEELIW